MVIDIPADALVRDDTRLLLAVVGTGTAKVAETMLPPETAELSMTVCRVLAGTIDGTSVMALAVPVAIAVAIAVGIGVGTGVGIGVVGSVTETTEDVGIAAEVAVAIGACTLVAVSAHPVSTATHSVFIGIPMIPVAV